MALRIKEILKDRGLTITELAATMGVNRVNLSNMINGNPTLETLEKIASSLGVSPAELFERDNSSGSSTICPHCGKPIKIELSK